MEKKNKKNKNDAQHIHSRTIERNVYQSAVYFGHNMKYSIMNIHCSNINDGGKRARFAKKL